MISAMSLSLSSSGRDEDVSAREGRTAGALELDDRVLRGIADDRDVGILAALDPVDLLGEHAAEHDDSPVRGAEGLDRPVEDDALGLPDDAVLAVEGLQLGGAVAER